MLVDPQQMMNSRYGVGLASLIGRVTPSPLGFSLAGFLGRRIAARRTWKMVRSLRLNQWIARGEKLSKEDLDRAVQESFECTAHAIFDLYHSDHNPDQMLRRICYDSIFDEIIHAPRQTRQSQVFVFIHLAYFDFVGQSGFFRDLDILAVALPQTRGGYLWQNEKRRKAGMQIVSGNTAGLIKALDYLKSGGDVLTGMDRPISDYRYCPRFFNRPAAMPVHAIYLALKARVPVRVIGTYLQQDGTIQVLYSEPIEMHPLPDRHASLVTNAETVLKVIEGFIRRAPQQWAMTFPVWPDMLDKVPN
ncbi:MAG: lysophospholipid acyltransferase family protein [Omnitrophica WOR_2 bacterium]